MTYFGLMRKGQTLAEKKGLEKTAVKSLLLFASNLNPTEMYIKLHDEVPEDVKKKFEVCLDEYINKGRPVQYIIGYTYLLFPFTGDTNKNKNITILGIKGIIYFHIFLIIK